MIVDLVVLQTEFSLQICSNNIIIDIHAEFKLEKISQFMLLSMHLDKFLTLNVYLQVFVQGSKTVEQWTIVCCNKLQITIIISELRIFQGTIVSKIEFVNYQSGALATPFQIRN